MIFDKNYEEKKTKVNEGKVPQYYVEGSHDAIIDPEEWEMVQAEIARRRTLGRRYSGNNIFASRYGAAIQNLRVSQSAVRQRLILKQSSKSLWKPIIS